MKIDLHCHTKKIKSGDAQTREVASKELFVKTLRNSGVKIVAITNHNHFDVDQYQEFSENEEIIVWPGIELDIQGSNAGHVIVIANPSEVNIFDEKIKSILAGKRVDDFKITISEFEDLFSSMELIISFHHHKKPEISIEEINELKGKMQKSIFLLEPSNLKTAGIMIAHNQGSIIVGSDVQDWSNYNAKELPEIKYKVDNFKNFVRLIKKEPEFIKTFMDVAKLETVEITPFTPSEKLSLDIYKDVNVIFGGKATGKTEILKSLRDHFLKQGSGKVSSYITQNSKFKIEDLLSSSVDEQTIKKIIDDNLEQNFTDLKEWVEAKTTNISEYVKWKKEKQSKGIDIINSTFVELVDDEIWTEKYDRFTEIKFASEKIRKFSNNSLGKEKEKTLFELLNELEEASKKECLDSFASVKSLEIERFSITKIKNLIKSKKGESIKPNSTGLLSIWENKSKIYNSLQEIKSALELDDVISNIDIGNIDKKGVIKVEEKIIINPNNLSKNSKGRLVPILKLKAIRSGIATAHSDVFTPEFNNTISALQKELKENNILNLKSFISVEKRLIDATGNTFSPSSGEKAMLFLNHAIISDDFDYYFLDEPELSVGHQYINKYIIPRIKYLASINKTIVVTTHDANIAIRTMPLQSIFRVDEGGSSYKTYIGSPFLTDMTNQKDKGDKVKWIEVSLDTLEGGREALDQRMDTYGY